MRSQNLDRGWQFNYGIPGGFPDPTKENTTREVNLPHDYMIESAVREDAPARASSGFFTEGVAYYTRKIMIPTEWEKDDVFLKFDGVMMNATVDINGCKAALKHNGYIPFAVDITGLVYFGRENSVTITVNPSMQPNSRWYTGAGIFRSVELMHFPKLHISDDGIFGYTRNIEYDNSGNAIRAYLHTEIQVKNSTLDNKIAKITAFLTREDSDEVIISRSQKIQINPVTTETAYINITLDEPMLWDAENPNLYRLHASVTDLGSFRTHFIPTDNTTCDEASVLFGIKTVTADTVHGLRINGRTIKLKGGCLHHDNGMLGAVSLYDSEYRKLSIMKKIGFNAVRTTHNPPSSALLEACDRIGMYVFNEAFDAWGIMKQPGDYNQFFDSDWEKDLTAFMLRDRNHPCVTIWSTGNEIPERGGLGNGYTLATRIAEKARSLDPSRPISNAICSYWSGLDDELTLENMKKIMGNAASDNAPLQNADGGKNDTSWEEYSEAFTNGLDIVGYNYMEDKYPLDHEMFPERVILGSENYPKEIGIRWPMVESTPYVIGDFTWTAFDYIGEAGIGKSVFLKEDDPLHKIGPFALMSHGSSYPWRLANDADIDINGHILPQGEYRSVVWGSTGTYLYSYDPAVYGKKELISNWGFTDIRKNWNWKNSENKPVQVAVFSNADKVELLLNGRSIGVCSSGQRLVSDLPKSFLFDTTYVPGTLEAVSYKDGEIISKDILSTTGTATSIRLTAEKQAMNADGHSVIYVVAELLDEQGNIVPDADNMLHATVDGACTLAAFGSANPVTDENYTSGSFKAYRGLATAIIRSGYETGTCTLKITGDGLQGATITLSAD
jgi:beta-galactosidase